MWEAVRICVGYVPVRLCAPGKNLTDGYSSFSWTLFLFSLFHKSSFVNVSVSILIKVDSIGPLDSLLCISQVCLSCPLYFWQQSNFPCCSTTVHCIKNHFMPHRISKCSFSRKGGAFYQTAKILYWKMCSVTLSMLLQWSKRREQSFFSVLFRSSRHLVSYCFPVTRNGSDSNYVDIASR